jgi:FkbM family methyltransferase
MARRYRATRDNLLLKRARPCETTFGFRLYGGAGLDTSIRASGELDTFLALLAHCELVVDVGANVGLFTLLALRHGRRVVAVEPSPGNLALLYRNVVLDGVEEDLEIFPIALAARPGLGPLYGGGPGASLLRGWGSVKAPYETVVPLNTLDNVVRARRARMLIKVDVEGSEWSVLQGASETLDDDHAWIVENHARTNFEGSNPHFRDIFEIFWAHGYTATTTDAEQRVVTGRDLDVWVRGDRPIPVGANFAFARMQ